MAMQHTANPSNSDKHLRLAVLAGAMGLTLTGGVGLGLARHQQTAPGQWTTHAATVAAIIRPPQGATPVYLTRTATQAQALRTWLALGSTGGPDGLPAAAVVLAPPLSKPAAQSPRSVPCP